MAPSKSITSDLGAEQENNVDSSRIDIDSLPPEVTKADLFIARKFLLPMLVFTFKHNFPF